MDILAVTIKGKGGVEALQLAQRPLREPGPGEVRVRVAAAGLNRADLLQRAGFYPAPAGAPADIPGLEYAGSVDAVGAEVSRLAVGAPVMGIVGGGAMASHLIVHESEAMPAPPDMPLVEAAAIPEVFLTAYDALFLQGGLSAGQIALLHAAGSGIGTAAVQLAKVAGAITVGTARHQDKLDACMALGLDHGIVAKDKKFAEALQAATGGRLANVILDTVGAAYLGENVKALAPLGTLVIIGLLGGATAELPLGSILAKRLRVVGSVLRARSLAEKATLSQTFSERMLPLFSAGKLKPVIDRVMPAKEIQEAHAYMASNQNFGKILIDFQ